MGSLKNSVTDHFEKHSYVLVDNIVPQNYIEWCEKYYWHKYNIDGDYDILGDASPNNKSYGGDTFAEVLLFHILPDIEKVVNKELYPTYAFTRLYEEGQVLIKHKDIRNSLITFFFFLPCIFIHFYRNFKKERVKG